MTKGAAAGLLVLSVAFVWTINSPAQSRPSGRAVTLVAEPSAYTLANGIVSARIDKNSGDLLSVRFNEIEMLATIMGPDGLPNTTVDKPGMNKRGGGGRLPTINMNSGPMTVEVKGKSVGRADHLYSDGAIARNGITGVWCERDVPFDASAMKAGTNVLKLTVPAGSTTSGVIYDYLRLELDEKAK